MANRMLLEELVTTVVATKQLLSNMLSGSALDFKVETLLHWFHNPYLLRRLD